MSKRRVTKRSAPAPDDAVAIDTFLEAMFGTAQRGDMRVSSGEGPVIDRIYQYVVDIFSATRQTGWAAKPPRYVLGLALSFIGLAQQAKKASDSGEPDGFWGELTERELFRRYPRKDSLTLTLRVRKDRWVGIRGHYDVVASFFQHTLERTGFPHGPGDAANKWNNHINLLVDCFRLSAAGRRVAYTRLVTYAMAQYPRNTAFSQPVPRPPIFPTIIEEYLRSSPKEEAGSVYHAIGYGYLAADRPHLHVLTDKSRSSSRRQHRIGDLDCYYGADLELAVEVKDLDVSTDNAEAQLGTFSRQVRAHAVKGLAFLRSISADAEESLKPFGVLCLCEEQLLHQVALWDWKKQDIAVSGVLHYLSHIEQRPEAVQRLLAFIKQEDPRHDALRHFSL